MIQLATVPSDPRTLPRHAETGGSRHLLSSVQMATFVRDGFLRFDALIPPELCARWREEIRLGVYNGFLREGIPLANAWPDPLAAGAIFRLPVMQGIIESLVGPHCRYDHHCAHMRKAGDRSQQLIHQDAEIDLRDEAFDIQISVFPHDVPADMGGTLFVPGSHFRRVHESTIGVYHNIVGQVQTVCPAGTVVVWHHNLWHAGRANHTDRDRTMFKLRLNPMVRQRRLWDLHHDDSDSPEVRRILLGSQDWYGQETRRELYQRVSLWRSLTGNADFELPGFYHERTANRPQAAFRRSAG